MQTEFQTGLYLKMQPNFKTCITHQIGCLKESYFFRGGKNTNDRSN